MKIVLKSLGKVVAEKEIFSLPSIKEKVEFRNQHLGEEGKGLVEIEFSSIQEREEMISKKYNPS